MRSGFENKVPKTADEFAEYFRNSQIGRDNVAQVKARKQEYSEDKLVAFRQSARAARAEHLSKDSIYLISYPFVPFYIPRRATDFLTRFWRLGCKFASRWFDASVCRWESFLRSSSRPLRPSSRL